MTAQSSAKAGAFYKFLPYFLNKLSYLKPQLIMNCIFGVLSYPLVLLFVNSAGALKRSAPYMNVQQRQSWETLTSLSVMGGIVCILCLIGLFIFTVVTTVRAFRYLYDKSAVDMDYSLPLNHNTRFFADLAAVFVTSILPHLLAVLAGIIMIQFTDFEALMGGYEYQSIISTFIKGAFTGLAVCVMEVGFTLFAISLCGRRAEAYIYPILLNFAVPLIHCMCIIIYVNHIYGAMSSDMGQVLPIAGTSPLGLILMSGLSLFDSATGSPLYSSSGIGDYPMPLTMPQHAVSVILLTVALIAGAYFLIKFRRTERVGMPFVYRAMDFVVPGAIIFAMSLPLCYAIYNANYGIETAGEYLSRTIPFFIGLIISTFVVYVIMQLISGRGFRRFHITLAKWACSVALVLGGSGILSLLGASGLTDPIPFEGMVKYVDIQIGNEDHYFSAVTDDESVKKLALEVHRMIPRSDEGTEDEFGTVSITYRYKNGECWKWYYRVTRELSEEFLNKAATPEIAYAAEYSDWLFAFDKESVNIVNVRFMNQSYAPAGLTPDSIIEAEKLDYQDVDYDKMYNSTGEPYRVAVSLREKGEAMDLEHVGYLNIDRWKKNTIALFKSHGIDLERVNRLDYYSTAFICEYEVADSYSGDVQMMMAMSEGIPYEEYARTMNDRYGLDLPYDGEYDPGCKFGKVSTGAAELEQLYEVSSDQWYSRYYLVLTTAESFSDYSNNTIMIDLSVDQEGYALASEILDRTRVQTESTAVPQSDMIYPETVSQE